jgi:uncharacterized repeat protein (TIGR03943 family)
VIGRYARALLLFGFAAMIARLFQTGDMAKYMSPSLDPLTALAGAVLALMGVVELARGGEARAEAHPSGPDHDEHGGHDWGEQATTVGLLLVPLLLGLFVPPRALGAAALGGESVVGALIVYAPNDVRRAASPPPPPAPIEDVPDLLGYLRRAGVDGVGQRARAVGIALPDAALQPGELALLRFSIAHCVADAQPLGVLVDASGAGARPESLATGGWVVVEGTIDVRERDDRRYVTIVADRVAPTDEPAQPYVRAGI